MNKPFGIIIGEAVLFLLKREAKRKFRYAADKEECLELIKRLERVKEDTYIWRTQKEYERMFKNGS